MAIRASDRASSTGRLRLTVDDAGLDGQLLDRGRHEREAVGEIMAVSGELPNATAAPPPPIVQPKRHKNGVSVFPVATCVSDC